MSAAKIRELNCWRKSFEIIWVTEWAVVLRELRMLDVFERSYVPVQLLLFDIWVALLAVVLSHAVLYFQYSCR